MGLLYLFTQNDDAYKAFFYFKVFETISSLLNSLFTVQTITHINFKAWVATSKLYCGWICVLILLCN